MTACLRLRPRWGHCLQGSQTSLHEHPLTQRYGLRHTWVGVGLITLSVLGSGLLPNDSFRLPLDVSDVSNAGSGWKKSAASLSLTLTNVLPNFDAAFKAGAGIMICIQCNARHPMNQASPGASCMRRTSCFALASWSVELTTRTVALVWRPPFPCTHLGLSRYRRSKAPFSTTLATMGTVMQAPVPYRQSETTTTDDIRYHSRYLRRLGPHLRLQCRGKLGVAERYSE